MNFPTGEADSSDGGLKCGFQGTIHPKNLRKMFSTFQQGASMLRHFISFHSAVADVQWALYL